MDKAGLPSSFDLVGHLLVLTTILLTVYGQLVLKWQIGLAGTAPADPLARLFFLAALLLKPWILSGFLAAFLASFAWMGAMTRLPLTYAYPFTSLSFVLVMLFTGFVLGEGFSTGRVIGTLVVMAGLVVIARS
jgi:drug/metabolite transporter (DMT)-like permease